MKLASFESAGRHSWGIVDGSSVLDLGIVLADRFSDLRQAIDEGTPALLGSAAADAPRYPLNEVNWLPVIPNPDKIICVGLNYDSNRVETGRAPTDYPVIFARFASSQTGHLTPIIRPKLSTDLDYEGELAVIIGCGGRHIPRDEAWTHVAGLACYNDATLRDWQRHTHQFTPGKNFPSTGAFGPWMVTPDEIDDFAAQRITTRLNGQVMQEAGFDQLLFDIPFLINYCSSFTKLEPGDVIATGTPGGVGFKRNPPVYMKPGDVVEVEISNVGLLINKIEDEN